MPTDTRCEGRVGQKPYWMGVDQWGGGCRCVLPAGHAGECQCDHTVENGARP